jgi:hypothetical protein
LGPIDRASPSLRTLVPASRWGIPSQAQQSRAEHKPSERAKKTFIFKLCAYEALHQRTLTIEIIAGERDTPYGTNTREQVFPFSLHLAELLLLLGFFNVFLFFYFILFYFFLLLCMYVWLILIFQAYPVSGYYICGP